MLHLLSIWRSNAGVHRKGSEHIYEEPGAATYEMVAPPSGNCANYDHPDNLTVNEIYEPATDGMVRNSIYESSDEPDARGATTPHTKVDAENLKAGTSANMRNNNKHVYEYLDPRMLRENTNDVGMNEGGARQAATLSTSANSGYEYVEVAFPGGSGSQENKDVLTSGDTEQETNAWMK